MEMLAAWPTNAPLLVGSDGERITRGSVQSRVLRAYKKAAPNGQRQPRQTTPLAAHPARRRRAAAATSRWLVAEILQACRDDPSRDALLVQALIAATDPVTGRALTDEEIRDELMVFMLAGHDTTATTLSYALRALGHHADMT
jgi:cytochrome P450